MPIISVYVPKALKEKVKEYNTNNPYNELNVSKVSQDAIESALKTLGY